MQSIFWTCDSCGISPRVLGKVNIHTIPHLIFTLVPAQHVTASIGPEPVENVKGQNTEGNIDVRSDAHMDESVRSEDVKIHTLPKNA